MSAYNEYCAAAMTICAVNIDTTCQHTKLAARYSAAAVPWHAAWLQSCWHLTFLWQGPLQT